MKIINESIDSRYIKEPDLLERSRVSLPVIISMGLLVMGTTAWAYWSTITDLFREWKGNDDYSAGMLVPLIALFLVWHRRKELRGAQGVPYWPAVGLLMIAQATRAYGLLFMYESAQRYSLVLSISALTLMVAGTHVFRKVFWIMMFLFLMVPLPGKIHNLISGPLQNFATSGSVFLLETFGAGVRREGNIVTLNSQMTMAVEEACSGLRMLMAFIIVAAFVAFMVKRSRLQKTVLLLSSVPVAIMCNIFRLCVTAILFKHTNSEIAEKFFHDFAGLAMMPAAVVIMFGELWIMNLLTENETSS